MRLSGTFQWFVGPVGPQLSQEIQDKWWPTHGPSCQKQRTPAEAGSTMRSVLGSEGKDPPRRECPAHPGPCVLC